MPPEPTTAPPTVWTIRALSTWTASFLAQKKNLDPRTARLESEILLAHVLECPRIELVARYDEEPPEADRTRFRELIKRRVDGWPVAYLTERREFYSLKFRVTPAVLVPRPETETLVMEALRLLKPLASPAVLDLGTGSGCIAVSIARQHKTARVTAVDVSPDALEVAKENAAALGVADRVAFLAGDLFAPLPPGATFDAVVSNPPYIAAAEFATLPPEVRDHEPRTALDGGPDGLAFYRRIAAGAPAVLKPGGWVLVEIGATQNDAVRALFAAQPGLEVGKTLSDGTHPRVVTAKRK